MNPLLLGTRGSELALAQAREVAMLLEASRPGIGVELKIIRTTGDERLDLDLSRPGPLDKGLFTKQLEQALLQGQIDIAVHSLKDLPVDLPEGLVLGAIPQRADPSDVSLSKSPGGLRGLPLGARVATSSPRRTMQVRMLRPDVEIVAIRGNVPTRVRKLARDESLHALVLAKAGLDRLGQPAPSGIHVQIEPGLLPAPGQGALGIQCRAGDSDTFELLRSIHHGETARCVEAERGLLKSLGGGCAAPLGALARIEGGVLVLRSIVFERET